MADKSTFIKLDRNIINWRWFTNSKILSVFIWLILKANIKTGHFEKDTIARGSLVTSNAHIATGCGLTIQNVRTALADLEETGEISRIIRNHYQVITIINYEKYQVGVSKTIGQLTSNPDSNSQATHKQLTTIKEYKNGKNKKIKENRSAIPEEPYPCGAAEKPRWMAEDIWNRIRYRTTDNIPGIDRGFYDTYIEYVEDMLKQGREIG